MLDLKTLVQMLLPVLGGGAVGSIITALVQHRRTQTQAIPLIERVNRLVSSDLKGFVLARFGPEGGGGEGRHLEAVLRVHEYQFTLRNTSHIHLHNAEVQFEFPSKDVDGRAERPSRSKTTPVQVDAEISEPWKAGYRWRIPELPPDDSIDFTFRAVEPSSAEYEVALYNGGQVVIEKSKGEPEAKWSGYKAKLSGVIASAFVLVLVAEVGYFLSRYLFEPTGEKATVVDWAGCSLNITSSSRQVNFSSFSQAGPWSLDANILNTGARKCFVKWESSSGDPFTIDPGKAVGVVSEYTNARPRLEPVGILFGPDGPNNKATVMLYLRGKP